MIAWLEAIQELSLGSHMWPEALSYIQPVANGTCLYVLVNHIEVAFSLSTDTKEALSYLSNQKANITYRRSPCRHCLIIDFYDLFAELRIIILVPNFLWRSQVVLVKYLVCYKCAPHYQDVFFVIVVSML